MVDALTDPTAQLDELATRLEAQAFVRMSFRWAARMRWSALGSMWKARWRLLSSAKGGEPIVSGGCLWQCRRTRLAVGLEHLLPDVELIV